MKLTWGDTSIPQTDVPKHVIAPIGRQFQVPIPTSPCLLGDVLMYKLGDVGHPSSPCLDIPKPKHGDVGHPFPILGHPQAPKLGNVGYGIIWVGSTKHHFIE